MKLCRQCGSHTVHELEDFLAVFRFENYSASVTIRTAFIEHARGGNLFNLRIIS